MSSSGSAASSGDAWRWVGAVLSLACSAIAFAVPALFDGFFLPGFELSELGHAMQIEWLVLASGLFVSFALMLPAHSRVSRTIRWVVFGALASAFIQGAYQMHGLRGVVTFALLMHATFGAAMLDGDFHSANRSLVVAQTLVRWVVCMMLFFPLLVAFDLGRGSISNWETKARVAPFGAIYFTGLTLLEALLYPRLFTLLRQALDRPQRSHR